MSLYYDIVVVGSGAAGLTAAAIAASEGLNTLIVEKQATLGETTMLSGGTVWVPNNSLAEEQGVRDTKDAASRYIDAATGLDTGEHIQLTAKNRMEYLNMAPRMIAYLQEKDLNWTLSKFPDYQPYLYGALPTGGRTLNPDIFDVESLGSWKDYLNISSRIQVPNFESFRYATRLSLSPQPSRQGSLNSSLPGYSGSVHVSMGCSLIAQLLLICKLSNRVTIWTESALCDMLLEEDKAVGVELRKGDERWTVRSQAVFLAVAGFARNQGMREEYLQKPASADWTLAHSSGDDGNVLKMMVSKRAKTSLLQEAWGVPVIQDPLDGRKIPGIFELSKPHCILVNQCGRRFCSEARPYGDYNLDADAKAPSWLILDSVYLRKYTLGSLSAQESKIEMAVQRGYLTRSSTLSGLAIQLRIEPDNLTRTLDEWNEMCEGGKDIEFGKGGDEYQRFIGDESMKPNPNMGTISVPPFYAIPVFPGDAGTKGGLLTDEKGRVLHENGGVIDGLYASGNVTASPFGKSSIGAGITIGPAMTFAYTAVKHLCEKLENGITVGN